MRNNKISTVAGYHVVLAMLLLLYKYRKAGVNLGWSCFPDKPFFCCCCFLHKVLCFLVSGYAVLIHLTRLIFHNLEPPSPIDPNIWLHVSSSLDI